MAIRSLNAKKQRMDKCCATLRVELVYARPLYPERVELQVSALGSQNGPSRPIRAKMPTISSGAGRRESMVRRLPYQVSARNQICSRLTNGRTGTLLAS